MEITEDIVAYLATLSKLRIDESEIGKVSEKLNEILGYMKTVNDSVNTDDVRADEIPVPHNVMREDEVRAEFARAELLANCPEHTDATPVVPKTVE